MSVDANDLGQYEGKKVVLVVAQEDGTAAELEGTADKSNALGVLFKPKGKVKLELIEADKIEDIRLAPDSAPTLKAKPLKPVVLGQARGHLLERHGFTLAEANDLSEDEAFELHGSIDHKADGLGHYHEDKSTTPAAQAVAAESDAA